MTTERIAPRNLDAERSVLGSCFLHPDAIDVAADILTPESFLSDAHGKIFAAMLELHRDDEPVDNVTVGAKLEAAGQLADVGGPDVLADITVAVPHAAHVAHYSDLVKECWSKREIINATTRALSDAYSPANESGEILADLQTTLGRLDETISRPAESRLGDLLVDVYRQIEAGAQPGIPTGFVDLDDLTHGLRPGSLTILAARPSVGKTAFASNVATNVAKSGHAVMFFSLEQSKPELAERILVSEAGVDSHSLRSGQLTEQDHIALREAANRIDRLPVHIDDSPGMTVPRMISRLRIAQRRHGVELAIVDYLQLIEPEDRRAPREQQVAAMSRRLKRMAQECHVPVVALAQLNREVEARDNKRPRLSDLRESGAIEQDADLICFLSRANATDDTAVELLLSKHRNGRTGIVNLIFDAPTMTFRNAAKHRFEF